MIPELGHFSLILALLVALVLGTLPLIGAARGNASWVALARPAAQVHFLLIAVAFGCLAWSFYVNDFSVVYVAEHSNLLLSTIYRLSAVWSGHEGSLLLWVFMLSAWIIAVAFFSRQLPEVMVARVLGVLGLVSVGLLAFILFTSNPFTRLLPAAVDGHDLEPLLQDPGLALHPPMLYMGYVGMSVAFAFAIAALLAGQLDAAWARWSRPWTLAAWVFLTLGIALGSWWAYYEMGWGGWWFWDPAENASFIPWLVGTALIHSLAITEKRGSFKNWTVLLAIAAFSLSLLGTFVVRSGVVTSVHAFASDPRRGVFILVLLAIVVGASLMLFAWRAPKVGLGGAFSLVSRETLLLINNVLLVVVAASVLLGTLYPLIIDALNRGKLSVGPPYFNTVFVPIMVPLLLLIAAGPIARWKHADLKQIALRLRVAAVIALCAGIGLPFLAGTWTPLIAIGLLTAAWIAAASIQQIIERLRVSAAPPSFWGMHIAHLGVAVFVVGITMVGGYQEEKDVRMAPGDTITIADKYTFAFVGSHQENGPNYSATVGAVDVSVDGRIIKRLHPEKRIYASRGSPSTETAIDSGFTRDLYVALGEPLGYGAWAVRVYYKPFVAWIWFGCLFMAIGGLIAATDRRYRLKTKSAAVSPALEVAPS
jgi:cytochrome c-type biogenesis protein CcmF